MHVITYNKTNPDLMGLVQYTNIGPYSSLQLEGQSC